MKDRTKKMIYVAIIAISLVGLFWYSYNEASNDALNDYIGDEVWYVPAARNILHLLGVNLHYFDENTSSYGVNIILPEYNKTVMKLKVWRIAQELNYTVYTPYQNFPAVYYEIPAENYNKFLERISRYNLTIIPGFKYPDKENIQNYLNTEHPYLAKGIISIGMLIEDKPLCWRLPGMIEHLLIAVLVFLSAYEISKSYLASFIAFFFVVLDPLLFATSVAAMLDIHVAFFTALFLYFMVRGRDGLGGISIGLDGAAKLNGAFPYPVLFIKILWDWLKGKSTLLNAFYKGIILPGAAFLLANLPAMVAIGAEKWIRELLGSFKWHLSFKGEHPANSPFWQWFINEKPFAFHYNPDIFAHNDPILLLSMIPMIIAIPYAAKKRGKILIPFGAFWSIIGFYALQWILGGKTQFSFYATPLVPAAAVALGVFAYDVIKWEYFEKSLKMYWEWITRAFREVIMLFKGREGQKEDTKNLRSDEGNDICDS
ncbi:phospholipid carrier-dependent glycosyltransferase [Palaeococcus sp. (in: euryarchaeotes)]